MIQESKNTLNEYTYFIFNFGNMSKSEFGYVVRETETHYPLVTNGYLNAPVIESSMHNFSHVKHILRISFKVISKSANIRKIPY